MVAISVVMAVRNGGSHLASSVRSILGQLESDLELIVIDDGSDDETPQVLRAAAEQDARVRVITRENRGLTRSLIEGCRSSRGVYIARHDAGDSSHPRRFQLQRAALDRHPELAFVSCWTQMVGPELEPLFVSRGSGVATLPASILDECAEHGVVDGPSHHGSVMMRRESYERAGGYREAFRYGQDWDLWYRIAVLGRFMMIPEVLYTARIDAWGISQSARSAQSKLAMLSHAALLARLHGAPEGPLLERAAAVGAAPHSRLAEARGFYFIGETLRRNGHPRAAVYLRKAVERWPLMVKAWVRLIVAGQK